MVMSTSSKMSIGALLILALLAANIGGAVSQASGLKAGFYKGKCKTTDVENTVKSLAASMWKSDKSLLPAFLRLCFHDAFVRGLDASILIKGPNTESTAGPNLSVRGFGNVDTVKSALEKKCPKVVSCADIIVLLTREFVNLAGGPRYSVSLGRRDGSVSLASEASNSLPAPDISVPNSLSLFSKHGLNAQDFVLLMGCHSVGVTHCSVIKNYIWGKSINSTMNSAQATALRKKCPNTPASDNTAVFLDQLSPNVLDKVFLQGLQRRLGVLPVDENLYLSSLTKSIVNKFSAGSNSNFLTSLATSLNKLTAIGVLTGKNGKIRTKCSVA